MSARQPEIRAATIIKHYLSQQEQTCSTTDTSLTFTGKTLDGKCVAKGEHQSGLTVVLTMPVPQILQLQGDVGSLMGENQRRMLEAVIYSSRYALGLFFKADTQIDVPWVAKYVSNNPCIRFIAIDDKKRNLALKACGVGPSVVVHTSVPFGIQHLEEEKDVVQAIILEELEKVMPDLPQPDSIKCQKWRYSQ